MRLSIHHSEPLFDTELLVDDLYEPAEDSEGSSSEESGRMSRARSDSQVRLLLKAFSRAFKLFFLCFYHAFPGESLLLISFCSFSVAK